MISPRFIMVISWSPLHWIRLGQQGGCMCQRTAGYNTEMTTGFTMNVLITTCPIIFCKYYLTVISSLDYLPQKKNNTKGSK
jgi:hypothetical protein